MPEASRVEPLAGGAGLVDLDEQGVRGVTVQQHPARTPAPGSAGQSCLGTSGQPGPAGDHGGAGVRLEPGSGAMRRQTVMDCL